MRRPSPHWAETQKDYNLKSSASRSHPASPLRISRNFTKGFWWLKGRGKKKKKGRTAILGYLWPGPALLQICTSFHSLECEPEALKLWTCSEVFWLMAHLRRRHIDPSPQQTLTNNFSMEMTRKQSKISRHTRKQDNLNINKNHQKSQTTGRDPQRCQILKLLDPDLLEK